MSQAKTKRRLWIIAAFAIVATTVAVGIVRSLSDPLHSKARREWAAQAIATIDQRINDKAWLASELSKLKTTAASRRSEGGWVADELLVARNGEWMVCENVCAKEQSTSVRKDIFIGRGSDGRWYYSTFHFCIGKCVLQIESQPTTLAQLVDGFWMVAFNGTPEDCLNETWTGGAYGDMKIRAAASVPGPQ